MRIVLGGVVTPPGVKLTKPVTQGSASVNTMFADRDGNEFWLFEDEDLPETLRPKKAAAKKARARPPRRRRPGSGRPHPTSPRTTLASHSRCAGLNAIPVKTRSSVAATPGMLRIEAICSSSASSPRA